MIKEVKLAMKRVGFFAARSLFGKEQRPPAYLGRTFAVGFCAGMFVIYGQVLLCFLVWLVLDRWLKLRFNLAIASLLTLISISNPITMPFVMYLYYVTGQIMTGESIVSLPNFLAHARTFMANVDAGNLWDRIMQVVTNIGGTMMLGSLPWHVGAGFIGYGIGIRVHWRLRKIAEERRKARKTNGKPAENGA